MLANLSIFSALLSLLSLMVLHFVSREFQPSWRMVSEYAQGNHTWLITSFFLLWGVSSILIGILILNLSPSLWLQIGVIFLCLSGIGAIMGGLFDVNHKLHGLAFMLGIPTFIVGSLLTAYPILHMEQWAEYKSIILWSTHAIWISVLLMGISMGILFSGFKKAGIDFGPDATPPEKLPDGITAFNGYANRLLIICYLCWNALIGYIYLTL